jgi:hypothetical protein
VLHVDIKKKTVTVLAGIRVAEVVDALREHGLTLQNFASIREQQVGGFTQVCIVSKPSILLLASYNYTIVPLVSYMNFADD